MTQTKSIEQIRADRKAAREAAQAAEREAVAYSREHPVSDRERAELTRVLRGLV